MNLSSIKDFKNLYEGLKVEDSFSRNLAITFSGQAFGQIIGFAFTPFLARVYGPESYGIFALFFAITANISLVSTFQLPTGFVAAADKKELRILLQISIFILTGLTILSILALIFFKEHFSRLFDAGNLSLLIYLIPLYVFFMGCDYILLGWNIYLKEFGRSAVGKIISTIASKGGTLMYGIFIASTPAGLIGGNLIIYPVEICAKLSQQIRGDMRNLFTPLGWKEAKKVIIRFKSYPLFVTPGLLITSLSGQLPVYFFSIYFHNAYVGLFALANSIITVPISIITNSTTTVFLQKAAETKRVNDGLLKGLVLALHKKLFFICFLPLTVFAFISDWAFNLVFGVSWEGAGWVASFLAISAILAVPQHPLSVLFRLLNREHDNFALNGISILLKVAGLAAGVFYNDIKIAIAGYSLACILSLSISLMLIFKMVGLKPSQLFWYLLSVLIIFGVVCVQQS